MSQVGLDAFPADVRRDVEGLEVLGYIEDEFRQWGHSFVLRTLKGEEELAAAVVTKEYVETLGQAKAWAWVNVALSLQAVDGKYDFCPPIGPDPIEFARARFKYVTSKWHWPLAEFLFTQFVELQQRQYAVLEAMRDFSVGSQPISSPGLGSLTDLGISPEDLAEEDSTPSKSSTPSNS